MRLASFDPAEFSSQLSEKTTIVTNSAFAAGVAAKQFSDHQLSLGRSSWERPSILSLDAWSVACWQEARYRSKDIPALLSPSQELVLWRQIIEADHPELFDLHATARLASLSAQLVEDWQIPTNSEEWNDHTDAQCFLRWHGVFRQTCQRENWMSRHEIWRWMPGWVKAKPMLLNIEEPTPVQARFFGKLGVQPIAGRVGTVARPAVLECNDFASEMEEAARWARATFEARPDQSVAIFVPGLSGRAAEVERMFQSVFYPARAVAALPSTVSCFRIDANAPLLAQPLASSALLILNLAKPRIDSVDASAILRCPFVSSAEPERNERAFADVRLRLNRELDISLYELERATSNCPQLSQIWKTLGRLLLNRPPLADLPWWSRFMADLLEILGWPGDLDLSADEQEIVEGWKRALSTLGALGLVARSVTYEGAIDHLRQLLHTGAPQTGDWSSPIQIIDASEAGGLAFDSAFAVGLSEENWPTFAPPPPFVPLKLQRTFGVPVSTPETLRLLSLKRTRALFTSASDFTVSYSGSISPTAASFFSTPLETAGRWNGNLPLQSFAAAKMDIQIDTLAPPYRSSEAVRGGASILKAQSACPFKAFAEIRLQASSPEDACFGFDARDRGKFLHTALEQVWLEIKSQDRLREMDNEARARLIDTTLDTVVSCSDRDSELHREASAAERERLTEVMLDWLAIEAGRLQPFTVETLEEERTLDLPGLSLRLRVDRADRLDDGKLVLIDYKSGEQKLAKLDGERPGEPQLLIYASALGDRVDGIFFGQIKSRDLEPLGYSRTGHFPKTKNAKTLGSEWPMRLLSWKTVVERLGREFVDGYAAVNPVKEACAYCHSKPICRIQERRAFGDDE